MTLYFENPVNFPETGTISTNGVWHPNASLLAIASYSQEKGGFVTIFDELGEPLQDVNYPYHSVSQVTGITWHPERSILVTGWENGELRIWNGPDKEFMLINAPHKAPVMLIEFSEKGGRLVTADSTGSLVGWKVDNRGQIVTAFHHDLRESITHLTFRLTIRNHPDFDIEGLAKAAVNGDEHALDMFSNWRPKTTARKFRIQEGADNHTFYVGTQAGSIYYVNNSGACTEVLNTEGIPLNHILYHPNRDVLVVMMEGLTIGHFTVDNQGHLTEYAKVKLSGRSQSIRGVGSQSFVWAGNSCLAILTGDLTVRIWDIDTNDNYVLPTTFKQYSEEKNNQISEIFTCLSYCKTNQTLCAGTNIGRIYFWTKRPNNNFHDVVMEDSWELNNINSVCGTVKQIMWGSESLRLPLLSVNCVTKVYIMKEQNLCTTFSEKVWATQNNAYQIILESKESNHLLQLDMQVTDMSITEKYIAITNGRIVAVYEILWRDALKNENQKLDSKLISSFSCDNECVIMHEKRLITLFVNGVTLRTVTGVIESMVSTVSSEGEPIGMDVCANYLVIFTMDGYLKIYDISERELRLTTTVRNFYDMCPDFGEIIQAKINSTGNKLALTVAASNLIPDGKLYVWDVENDNTIIYDFKKSHGSFEIYEDNDDANEALVESNETKLHFDKICKGRIPLCLYWDYEDPRLLVFDAKKIKTQNKGFKKLMIENSKDSLENEDHIIITMFVSTEYGLRIQDIRALDAEARLLAVCTPFVVLLKKLTICKEVMSDFNGLEDCNKETRKAVLDFSYHLSLGNMDAAFKAIKLVQSPGVWSSLARMCVKTKRLDVAGVCLGHIGNARAAQALRQAVSDDSLPFEAKLAALAIQLDMLDEAEQLYIQCERYDLLNKFKQNCNKMDEALEIAQSKDRIHLRNTEHTWARMLEQSGNYKEAIKHYENANTHRYDVPRMLAEQPQQLEAYIMKAKDPQLYKWWGQYIESQGDMTEALKMYTQAGDVYSQVRILCFMDDENKAADLARSSNDKAAFYHMARFYETSGNIEEAISFFARANAYSNAVRLCKENHLLEELWNVGSVAGNREKLECAQYFEEQQELDKAVILYHRAGMLHKALDLAFKTQQFDTLQQIAADLDSESDPTLIEKCAEYFVSNQQYDKAVDLLAIAQKYQEAINVCLMYNVQVTEELTEKLTPEKGQVDEEVRLAVLEKLAETLLQQGNYHLATKKFTQAGDKVRGMKSLLKSGDTEKIIFFAGVSRQKEIYIMAANYLQSLDWQNQPEILRHIITFYSKGKALDLLANFYVACAQVEIDEFQNYEKAFGALTEASRCLAKVTTPRDISQHKRAQDIVQQRMTYIKRFMDIKRILERGDTQTGLNQCKQLLTSGGAELEASVRRGDIYALMIQQCIHGGNFLEAKQLFNELRQVLSSTGNAPITYYVNKETIEALAKGLGVHSSSLLPSTRVKEENIGADEIEEEVVEE